LKRYQVKIIEDAEYDLNEIFQYLASHDSIESADYVLEQLESRCLSLSDFPLRGHIPPELDHIGVTEYREVLFKPYRIIYQIDDPNVFIHCILDGRRDMSTLLERRLLR